MELRSKIPKTEAWKIRKAAAAEALFRERYPGAQHEILGVSLVPRQEIIEIVTGEIAVRGLAEDRAFELIEEVSLALEEGPDFGQDRMLVDYSGGVAYL